MEFWKQFPLVSLKTAMQTRYPEIPGELREKWMIKPLSPLSDLLLRGGYSVKQWDTAGAMELWFEHLPDQEAVTIPYLVLDGRFLNNMVRPFLDQELFFYLSSGGIPRPTGAMVEPDTRKALVHFLLELHIVPEDKELLLDRLFNYMEVSQARYGVVTSLHLSWMCKRVSSDLLLVSEAVENPLMAIGFVVQQAREDRDRVVLAYRDASLVSFDCTNAVKVLKSYMRQLQHTDADKILSHHAVVNGEFSLQDLEDVKVLPLHLDNKIKSVAVLRGTYRGQRVVVKVRDLSSMVRIGFLYSLYKFCRELECYLRLRHVQGRCVPKLLSWGLLRGAMFVFVMTSDGGVSRLERWKDDSRLADKDLDLVLARTLEEQEAKAIECLREIHKRGILVTDINSSKIVRKVDEHGNVSVQLVGFGDAEFAEVLSDAWYTGCMKDVELGKKALRNI